MRALFYGDYFIAKYAQFETSLKLVFLFVDKSKTIFFIFHQRYRGRAAAAQPRRGRLLLRPQKGSQGSCGPLGRQTQTRMRRNFEEERGSLVACVRWRAKRRSVANGDGPATPDEIFFFQNFVSWVSIFISLVGPQLPWLPL